MNGVQVTAVYNRSTCRKPMILPVNIPLPVSAADAEEFLNNVDAVYVASPHLTHYSYVKWLLENDKHVLCRNAVDISFGRSPLSH